MLDKYEFDSKIYEIKDNGGAYVIFPWDIRKEFGAGRVKVSVLFDGIAYEGSIVNMDLLCDWSLKIYPKGIGKMRRGFRSCNCS